jgi:hypothetical protein
MTSRLSLANLAGVDVRRRNARRAPRDERRHLVDLERVRVVAAHPALADEWRGPLLERVGV